MRLTRLDFFFWAAGFLLNLILLFTLVYRRRFVQFPVFTAVIALGVGKTVCLYLVRSYGSKHSYFVSYWSLTLVDMLGQLGVVYELGHQVFWPLMRRATDLRVAMRWLAGVSVGAALGLACLASPAAPSWIQSLATRGNLFAATLMSELFIAMMVVSVCAGIPWKSHAGAIAQGLGGYSLVSVLIEAGHAYFGIGRNVPAFVIFSQVRMVAYLVCVLYWIAGLTSDVQPARIMTREMRANILTMQSQVSADLRSLRFRKSK